MKIFFLIFIFLLISCNKPVTRLDQRGLKDLVSSEKMKIGSCMRYHFFAKDKDYTKKFLHDFDLLIPEAFFQWGYLEPFEGKFEYFRILALYDYAKKNNLDVRGHSLVWYFSLPEWLKTYEKASKEKIEGILKNHVTKTVSHFTQKFPIILKDWVVVNEALNEKGEPREILFSKIGTHPLDYVEKSFQWAHESAPSLKLIYNDFVTSKKKGEAIYHLVKGLLEKNIPVHGVGLQLHARLNNKPNFPYLKQLMKRISDLGLNLHITEMDVAIKGRPWSWELKEQAQIYKKGIELCLNNSSCKSFSTWGFTDKYSWLPEKNYYPDYGNALLYDKEYSPKASYISLQEALIHAQSSE